MIEIIVPTNIRGPMPRCIGMKAIKTKAFYVAGARRDCGIHRERETSRAFSLGYFMVSRHRGKHSTDDVGEFYAFNLSSETAIRLWNARMKQRGESSVLQLRDFGEGTFAFHALYLTLYENCELNMAYIGTDAF